MLVLCIVNLIAILGYYLFFVLILKEKEVFFPFCFISFTVLMTYLLGCAELLTLGCVVVMLLGICLLVISIMFCVKNKEWPDLSIFINPAMFFMLVGIIWCYVLSRNIYPSHYDDFSHWLRICKTMYADSSYPRTPECYYQNYVPGTATWIYYITSVIGYTPQNCYFAQMVLNLSCCTGLLAVIGKETTRDKKIVMTLVCGILSILLCAMDVTVYSLLVDGVLGLAAALAVIYTAATDKKGGCIRRFALLFIMCCFIALIKASGSLLVCFIAAVFFASTKDDKEGKYDRLMKIGESMILIIVPYLITNLYMLRAKRVFGEVNEQGTVSFYNRIEDCLSTGRVMDIIKRFMVECFDIVNAKPQVRILWIVMITIIVIGIIKRQKGTGNKQWSFISLFIPVVSVLWLIGMLLTFFTFDEREANSYILVSFDRYSGTMAIFAVAILSFYLLGRIVNQTEPKKYYISTGIFTAAVIGLSLLAGFHMLYIFGFKYYDDKMFTGDAWRYLEENYPERWDYNEEGYAMIIDVEQRDFDNCFKLQNLMTTYFRTTNCGVYDIKDIEAEGYTLDDVREYFPNIVIYYEHDK